jgi:serine protease inhibitor
LILAAADMPARLNRPFRFLIREHTGGAVPFLGHMTDPSA